MASLATMIPAGSVSKYPTVEELAGVLRVDRKWIRDRRAENVIIPRLTKGALQFDRGAIVRLAAYQALQDQFGEKSAIPARIVLDVAEDLDRCARGAWLSPSDTTRAIEAGLARIIRALREDVAERLAAAGASVNGQGHRG